MPSNFCERKPLGKLVHFGIDAGSTRGDLEHDGTQERHKLTIELARIFASLEGIVDEPKASTGITFGQRCGDLDDALTAGDAEQIANVVRLDSSVFVAFLVTIRRQLVEQTEGIPHASARMLGNDRQRFPIDENPFDLSHPIEVIHDGFARETLEIEPLAARHDRGQELLGIGRRQDEFRVRGWFFQGFEKRVRCRASDLVRFVDDVELGFQKRRREPDPFAQLSYVIDAAIAGSIDLDNVGGRSIVDGDAGGTFVAGTRVRVGIETVDRFGKQPGGGGLASSARAGEEVGMCYSIEPDCILQRTNDRVLTDQIDRIEGLRTVLSIQGLRRADRPKLPHFRRVGWQEGRERGKMRTRGTGSNRWA